MGLFFKVRLKRFLACFVEVYVDAQKFQPLAYVGGMEKDRLANESVLTFMTPPSLEFNVCFDFMSSQQWRLLQGCLPPVPTSPPPHRRYTGALLISAVGGS